MVVIGARTIWSALRPPRGHDDAQAVELEGRVGGRTAYLAGLSTNLGNPKASVFAISLLPAFAGAGFWPTLGLGIVWAVVTASWYLLFILLVCRGRTFMTRPGAEHILGGVSGVVLVVVGVGVALGG